MAKGWRAEDGLLPFETIADEMGVSRQRVMQLYARAMRKLSKEMHRRGVDADSIRVDSRAGGGAMWDELGDG